MQFFITDLVSPHEFTMDQTQWTGKCFVTVAIELDYLYCIPLISSSSHLAFVKSYQCGFSFATPVFL